MNAVLANRFAGGWAGVGVAFVLITLLSEALLLVVAGQAGFIDGPRAMANIAGDSFLPHPLRQPSDPLPTLQDLFCFQKKKREFLCSEKVPVHETRKHASRDCAV